jgi:uncharacterized membrane protein HdeD (DUF308 family)
MSIDKNKTDMNAANPAGKVIREYKLLGIIAAIAMILFGVLFVALPLDMAYLTEIFAMCGFIVYGAFRIVSYIRTPARTRRGAWTLANGILSVILGILIVSAPAEIVVASFAFILGFFAISGGINQIVMSGTIKRETGMSSAGVIVSGIINLVMGIFLLISPFALTAALEFVFGIYLIVGGVTLIIETLGRIRHL